MEKETILLLSTVLVLSFMQAFTNLIKKIIKMFASFTYIVWTDHDFKVSLFLLRHSLCRIYFEIRIILL